MICTKCSHFNRRGRSSLEEINTTIQSIHDTLAEHRAAGVLVSQFNRASITAARSGKGSARPTLEQLAATVAFLFRASDNDAETMFYSKKNRNSRRFDISLTWNGTRYKSRNRFAEA